MKAVKITNAEWLPALASIAKPIQDFVTKVKIPGVHGPGLGYYLEQTAQWGGNVRELWVVMEDNEPVAFAHWVALGMPHTAKVHCDVIYSWKKKTKAVELLIKEFIEFGKRCKAVWYSTDMYNEKIERVFKLHAQKHNMQVKHTGTTNVIFRRR